MAWIRSHKKGSGGGSSVEALVDHDNLVTGVFINPASGAETPQTGWSATPFVEVTPGETLTFATKNNGSDYFSYYDEDKTWINYFMLSDYGYVTYTVPNNVHYIRLSNQDANMAHLQAWRGL